MELVEIVTPGLSEVEQKKLAELKKFKEQSKLKKQEIKIQEKEKESVSTLKADALPPVMKRKGQWEMIPDFLKQKEVYKDINAI
jgi:hypothetical protein